MGALDVPCDKSKWPAGAWHQEPDRVEFEHEGFPCLISRVPNSGHLCGYVAVPATHPLYGQSFDTRTEDDRCLVDELDVHGGITYGEKCSGRVCHAPNTGEPDDVWWLGFDCAHCGDLRPASTYRYSSGRDVYRDVEYVRRECVRLAEQLKKCA